MAAGSPIAKALSTLPVRPNLADYETACREFSWEQAAAMLDGLPGGGLNIAHEAVGRHARGPLRDRVALRWLSRQGQRRDISFADLQELSGRFAAVLRSLEVPRGAAVFSLAGRIPELYIAALGTLMRGAVFCPLFSAFGPEPVQQRMTIGEATVLVTTSTLYRRKVAPIRSTLVSLEHVLVVPDDDGPLPEATIDLTRLLARPVPAEPVEPTVADDPALLHFTSGTTGRPKGALHVHGAVIAHAATARFALDLHPDDVFWCTADPGWVTGTSYGIVAPLVLGVTMVVDEAEFDAGRWYRILQDEGVTVWYTAPTAVRMLMKAGDELPASFDLGRLRFISSVGEPLNPEAVIWATRTLGLPIHDNWWQTETGGIMIANYAAMEIRPGSMGKPVPGVEAAVVEVHDGAVKLIHQADRAGELALKVGWPSMFRAYLHDEERYRKCFADGWYLTGDLVRRDADGYFWFVGRADDVIKSAGHLVGPFEVESVLMEHPAVLEAGVIGKPDPVAGAAILAFVVLRRGFEASDDLMLDILGFARKKLGPAVAPREVRFTGSLPKTRSGKIMRRLLKARELGLPEGDLSTLEEER